MLRKLIRKLVRQEIRKAYDAGLDKGYELGFMMGEMERTHRGLIIGGSKVDQQIEEILREKGE